MSEKVGVWRIIEILVPLGTPLAVAIIAWTFNSSESARDQRNKIEQERIARFALIPAFMDALSGADEKKRTLAVRTVIAILGAEGTALLAGLDQEQVAALSLEAQQVVTDAANDRATQLVTALYDSDISTRTSAYRDLLLSGLNDEKVIPLVISQGLANKENLSGLSNTLNYLKMADQTAINKWSDEVLKFVDVVESSGPTTKSLAEAVRSRLPDAP